MKLQGINFANLKTKPKVLIGICSPLVLLVGLGATSVYSISTIVETNKWVDHTRVVLSDAAGIVSSAVDMETGMRGYLLAGQDGFLDPYRSGEEATYQSLAALRETVSDNPGQVERLNEVETTLREWQSDVTEPTIALRREIGDAKTMNDMAALVGEARGKVYFDAFRKQISTFTDRERALLEQRRGQFATAQNAVGKNFDLVRKTSGWVDHTHEVLAKAAALLANAVDMETGMRGYLLAGGEEFLSPYKAGKVAFFEGIAELRATVSDNPEQVARLEETESTIRQWVAKVTEPAIALRRQVSAGERPLQAIETLVSRKAGKKYFDAFRGQIAAFSDVERNLMVERQGTAVQAGSKVSGDLGTMKENEAWVTHTYNVIARANAILSAAVDMETGMRGYLLAGRDEFLAPYTGGAEKFYQLVGELRETVSDNPEQVQLLNEVETTIRDWQADVTEPTIALRREIGNAKTMDDMADLVGEARGKVYFDGFRALMADFSTEEVGLMEQRQAANKSTVSNTFVIIGVCMAVAVAIGLMLAWLIGNGIANPIKKMTDVMQKLAGGDTSVEIPGTGRGDEIGAMAGTVQVFKDNAMAKIRLEEEQLEVEKRAEEEKREAQLKLADDLETSVKSVVQAIAGASTEMQATAEGMATIAQDASQQSITVASATEQASANVQTVAAASEELSSSISEISRQVSESRSVTDDAQTTSQKATATIQNLADMAQKVGDVVNLINDIADQTNLLALNATIEAARAGDAGKGFAVVATEVKSLASQTANATEEISSQISGMQAATEESVNAIEEIREVINQLGETATSIAAAVEEQSASTQEISRNAQEAAVGTQDVSNNISSVQSAIDETGGSADQVLTAASELSQQSEALDQQMDTFIADIRAA